MATSYPITVKGSQFAAFSKEFPGICRNLQPTPDGTYVGFVYTDIDIERINNFIASRTIETSEIDEMDELLASLKRDIDSLVTKRTSHEVEIVRINTEIVQKKSALYNLIAKARSLLKSPDVESRSMMDFVNRLSNYITQVQATVTNGTHHKIN